MLACGLSEWVADIGVPTADIEATLPTNQAHPKNPQRGSTGGSAKATLVIRPWLGAVNSTITMIRHSKYTRNPKEKEL